MNHLKSWWLAHAAWISMAAYFLAPSFQNYADKHPGSIVSAAIGLVLARVLQHTISPPKA